MEKNSKVLITGGHSAVALAMKDLLAAKGYGNIASPDRTEVDLTDLTAVKDFFQNWRPDFVLHIAGRTTTEKECGSVPWEVFRDNFLMEYNVFEASMEACVRKMIWVSSDSAFPYSANSAVQTEDALLQAPPKKRVEPYAMAKLVGTKMCEYIDRQQQSTSFVSLLPCFIYGNARKGLLYNLICDFIKAKKEGRKEVCVWGKGDLQYRLIHCRDVASAIFFAMNHKMKHDKYVVAPTEAISKLELSGLISDCVGYEGAIVFDGNKLVLPSTNASPARLCGEGWAPAVSLKNGIKEYVNWIMGGSQPSQYSIMR